MTVTVNHTTLADGTFSATGATAWDANHSVLGTAGRVLYATTGGVVTDSANLLYAGTDLTVQGVTVGLGGGAVADNTTVGSAALAINTVGYSNTAIGQGALNQNTEGSQNTAVGSYALNRYARISGQGQNTAVGSNAMEVSTNGIENVAIGTSALSSSQGNGNTCVGTYSGDAITSGSYNVILGSYTGFAAPISVTGSNYIVFSDGQANVRAYWNGAAATFNGGLTVPQVINSANAVTVSANAGTVAITNRINNFSNSSAAAMTITMATASAVDGQMSIVRVYDFSAVAQNITWVNTENSTVTATATSNGSTTLPLTVGFMYNSLTSKWRCIASA
jgi:hypothetical protein